MKKMFFLLTLLGCANTLLSYWDQIGSNSQVTPPTPTSKIALQDLETKSSKVRDYTIQKSLLLSLRSQLERGASNEAIAEAMNQALERLQQLDTPLTEGYLQKAIDEPQNGILLIDQALDFLESWYGSLPASE